MLSLTGNRKSLGKQLAGSAIQTGRYPLLLLPSTDAAFRLLADCEKSGMLVSVVGNPQLVAFWGAYGTARFLTPWSLWSTLKSEARLPSAVAIFEDQLAATDDSYLQIEFEGQRYMVSPIVIMILAKFKPPCYVGESSSPRTFRTNRIELVRYEPAIPQALSQDAINLIMGEVLRPLLSCADDTSIPWLARSNFALKCNNNIYRVLVQRLLEMESLVRVYRSAHPYPAAVLNSWLEVLRTSRLEVSKQLR